MDLSPGTEVAEGTYVVEAPLGSGGMAVVYRVVRVADGQTFALKVLSSTNSQHQGRLLREGRAQATLKHPHVVAVIDVLRIGEQPALLMDFVDGPALDRALKRVSFTLEQVDALADGILEGMAAAHRAGFVHRDLKPGNVMLATEGGQVVAKIADFGLVKTDDATGSTVAATRTGAMMGTPAYMAPEQVRDAKDVDARADVFALGAILYELLTRRRAFEGQDTFDVFEAIVRGKFESLDELMPELPERMRRAIDRALSVERDDRFASANELLAAWRGQTAAPSVDVWTPDDVESVRAAAPLEPLELNSPTWSSLEPAPSGATTTLQGAETVYPSLPPTLPARRSRWALLGLGGVVALGAATFATWRPQGDAAVVALTSEPDPVVVGTDTLVWTETAEPTTLNPLFQQNDTDRRVLDLLFDPLFYESAFVDEIQGRLVESWHTEDDGNRLVVLLRDDVKWSDGEPFDAEDVCFTYKAIVDPDVGSTIAHTADAVIDCVVTDTHVAAFDFARRVREPERYLPWHILPEHVFDGDPSADDSFSTAPVGTGPMVGRLNGERVDFEANPHDTRVKIRYAQMIGGLSQDEQLAYLRSGRSHGMISVAAKRRPALAASDTIALKTYVPRHYLFMALNPRSGALEHAGARRALDLSLDRDALIDATIGQDPDDPRPVATPISGPFPAGSRYADPKILPTSLDEMAAMREMKAVAALLDEDDEEPSTRFRVALQATVEDFAPGMTEALEAQLTAIGLEPVVTKFTDKDWRERVLSGRARNDFDAAVGLEHVGLIEDPGALLHSRYRGQGQRNPFAWSNPELDRLLDVAERAERRGDAMDAMREVHRIAHAERPYIFLWQQDTKSAWHNQVRSNTLVPVNYFAEFRSWRLGSPTEP
ncbi:MAG: protein kinase [Proteobacteria bacterium]|nr:protein kinase [Pseudomonadota bacterium]